LAPVCGAHVLRRSRHGFLDIQRAAFMTQTEHLREVLRSMLEFAYQHGFHELGYDPLDEFEEALLREQSQQYPDG
jgi:hypothetical protein